MADEDEKIMELTEYASFPAAGDMFPMVDVSDLTQSPQGSTKRASFQNMTKYPYGSFSDSTTQTIANISVAYPITFDTDEEKNMVTHSTTVNPSRIYLDVAGTYLITFSAVGKSTAPNKDLDIWLAVGGVNVPRSNTVSKFVGSGNERIITVTYIYTFSAGQYFELMWRSNDTGTVLVATGTQENPTRPACPSIILTVNKIA